MNINQELKPQATEQNNMFKQSR